MFTVKCLPILILFFLIFYFLILFTIEPFVVKSNLKTVHKVFVAVGFSIIPFFIIFAFVLSIIH